MENNLPPVRWEKRPLPKLSDLHHDVEKAFETDELNRLLSQPTPSHFIKKHPIVKVKVNNAWKPLEYVPEDKVRYLLTKIFGGWDEELIEVKQLANSIMVALRLTVINPFTGDKMVRIGIGAAPIQTDSGTALTADTVKANAVQIGAPAAASYAFKNAAKKLGSIFGGNLNKADAIEFTGSYQDVANSQNQNAVVVPGERPAAQLQEQFTVSAPVEVSPSKVEGMPTISTPF